MLKPPIKSTNSKLDHRRQNPKRVNRWFKWLFPGLLVKRWLLISAAGAILTFLGLAIWVKLTPIYRLGELVSSLLEAFTRIVPSYVSGPLVVSGGLFLILWGQSRTVGAITEAINPENNGELVDLIIEHRRLHRGPKIVAIGGGTGLSTLLRGLKRYSANITAIVTVADDGGSSGRLRRDLGVLPPGDIRNCLAALADEEKLLTELFQYRFSSGDGLSGHSFGNLFLSAMNDITGDLEKAIAASSKVLAVMGKVLPSTLADVKLWAALEDGRIVEGESQIPLSGSKIVSVGCTPANPPALPAAIKAIEDAEYIVIGPGSLYTSVIPNLLVPQIRDALANAKVPRIYICNIMTQPGETDGYTVADHIKAIDKVCKKKTFDAVLVHRSSLKEEALKRYAQGKSHPVYLDREEVAKLGRSIITANVTNEEASYVRHDPDRLAKVILRWYSNKCRR